MNIKQSIKYLRSRGYRISRPSANLYKIYRQRANGNITGYALVGHFTGREIRQSAMGMLRDEDQQIADAIAMATAGEVMR